MHVKRMDEYRMARRVLMAKLSGGRVRGRPKLGWVDGVKVALGSTKITVETERQCAKDRKEWRALVMIELNAAIFSWPYVLSDSPPALWWIITVTVYSLLEMVKIFNSPFQKYINIDSIAMVDHNLRCIESVTTIKNYQ